MPLFQSAKQIAENALITIGAFSSAQPQADAGDLKTALKWLEMLLNTVSGYRPLAGYWRIIDIPIEALVGDYNLGDYADASETQFVFSVSIVDDLGNVEGITMGWENQSVFENLKDRGRVERAIVTKDKIPVLKLFPAPTQEYEDMGKKIRVRIQTYENTIDPNGAGDEELKLRPSWYLWITKRLSYELGSGPIRRLEERELTRHQADYERLESLLVARDGQYNTGKPPVTKPMAGM